MCSFPPPLILLFFGRANSAIDRSFAKAQITARARPLNGAADGAPVILGLRPEHFSRAAGPLPLQGCVRLDATIEILQPTGSRTYATFRLGGEPVVAELDAHDVSRPGERIALDVNIARATLFDAQTERAI